MGERGDDKRGNTSHAGFLLWHSLETGTVFGELYLGWGWLTFTAGTASSFQTAHSFSPTAIRRPKPRLGPPHPPPGRPGGHGFRPARRSVAANPANIIQLTAPKKAGNKWVFAVTPALDTGLTTLGVVDFRGTAASDLTGHHRPGVQDLTRMTRANWRRILLPTSSVAMIWRRCMCSPNPRQPSRQSRQPRIQKPM